MRQAAGREMRGKYSLNRARTFGQGFHDGSTARAAWRIVVRGGTMRSRLVERDEENSLRTGRSLKKHMLGVQLDCGSFTTDEDYARSLTPIYACM